MIKIQQAVIVEGKYDKIKLSALLDTLIIATEGFGIFNNKEKQAFLRRLAAARGLLILTDSDAAGFQIRAFLSGLCPPSQITHAYIPDILGKERRKTAPSKEGKLGVEGMSEEILRTSLEKAGVLTQTTAEPTRPITNADLYAHGLTGTQNAKDRRIRLLHSLSLPARLCGSNLLKTLNTFLTYEEFEQAALALTNEKE